MCRVCVCAWSGAASTALSSFLHKLVVHNFESRASDWSGSTCALMYLDMCGVR